MSRIYESGAEWANQSREWDLDSLYRTTMFAAENILDLLDPYDNWRPESGPEIGKRPESGKRRKEMENAVNDLRSVNVLNTTELWRVLCRLYTESFAVVDEVIFQYGTDRMHEWIPTFKGYQDILSSAMRFAHHKKIQAMQLRPQPRSSSSSSSNSSSSSISSSSSSSSNSSAARYRDDARGG